MNQRSRQQDDTWNELLHMAQRMCDGLATTADRDRLDQLLQASEGARKAYLAYLSVHAKLLWRHRGQASIDLPSAALESSLNSPAPDAARATSSGPDLKLSTDAQAVQSPLLGFLGAAIRVMPGGEFTVGFLLLAVVVSAFVGLATALRVYQDRRDAIVDQPVVRLTGTNGCRWATSAPQVGTPVESAPLELAAGFAEFTFAGGARVVVEAPANLKVVSRGRIELDRGKLIATVPSQAIGFTVVTPTAEVVDLGTEFGVVVEGDGKTDVHVLQGAVEVKRPAASDANISAATVRLGVGQAVRVAPSQPTTSIPFEGDRFTATARSIGSPKSAASDGSRVEAEPVTKIWLGNLFDDRPHTPLAEAMRTDTFRAAADFNDLGVNRTAYGGEPIQEIAPGLRFDLTNLGWQDQAGGHVANDAHSDDPLARDPSGLIGGIRITGKKGPRVARLDEGIGTEANSLVTFALDEIRAAGKFGNRELVFICDRAGIDDTCVGEPTSSVHMAVIISSEAAVRSAFVDGAASKLSEQEKCWSVVSPIGEPMRGDGRFFSVRQALPADVKYLTFVSASAGDGISLDRAVWIGARLEVAP